MVSILKEDYSLTDRFKAINWGLVALIMLIAGIGFMALYSAGGGAVMPWAGRQAARFAVAFAGMFVIALIPVKYWFRLSYPLYALGLCLLIAVEIMGHVGMGAQRWIDLGFMRLQPSELMKIVVVMALARYFHVGEPFQMGDPPLLRRFYFLIPPFLMIGAPLALVLSQPDLGTGLMIGMAGAAMLFLAGVSIWLFVGGAALVGSLVPVAWHFILHDYQKRRITTFLDPDSDPLGAGYHITQSKIALGSGGIEGKGFLQGTQSHLNFLPEKQTDFIFTLWAEEWGLTGGLLLLLLFGFVFFYGGLIAFRCRHRYGQLMAFGLMINFSLYVFINIAMVMGLIPVVGAPLPLISYGGTAMLAALIGFGLMMSCSVYQDAKLPRSV